MDFSILFNFNFDFFPKFAILGTVSGAANISSAFEQPKTPDITEKPTSNLEFQRFKITVLINLKQII